MRLKTKEHKTTQDKTMMKRSMGMSLAVDLGQAGVDWQWTIDDDFVVPKSFKHKCTCGLRNKDNELQCSCV